MHDQLQTAHSFERFDCPVALEAPIGFVPLRLHLAGMSVDVLQPCAIIGRHSDADIRLPSPEVSRRHCKLYFREGFWRVQDLHSLNGVHVNDEKVYEATLYDGDLFRVGEFLFEIRYSGESTSPQAEVIRSIVEVLPKAS